MNELKIKLKLDEVLENHEQNNKKKIIKKL
jgi:hypothetical protein